MSTKSKAVIIDGDGSMEYSIEMPPGIISYILLNGCSLMGGFDYTVLYPTGEDKVTITFKKPPYKTDRLAVVFEVYEHYFSWCPSCFKKYRSPDYSTTVCVKCNTTTVLLDINDSIYSHLPEMCTKGDIVEASLGIAI